LRAQSCIHTTRLQKRASFLTCTSFLTVTHEAWDASHPIYSRP
jgi:hypothetical protein